jgi:hypothetical protein
LVCVSCLSCLLVARLARYICLTTYWFVFLAYSLPVGWLILPVMPAYYSRLLVGWYCLICMTNYRLVLPALPACWLACLASYACLLAACWLAGFACLA